MANQNFRLYYHAGNTGLTLDLIAFAAPGTLLLNAQPLTANGTNGWVYETGNVSGTISGHCVGILRDSGGNQLDQVLHFLVSNADGVYEGGVVSPRAVVDLPQSVVDGIVGGVLGEVLDEPEGPVEWNGASVQAALAWLLALSRNRVLQTATEFTLRNDANDGAIAAAPVSHDGTTYERGEFA